MRFTEYLHKNIFKHKSLWELFLPTPRELSELTGTFSFINISSSSWSRPSTGTMCAVAELRREKKKVNNSFPPLPLMAGFPSASAVLWHKSTASSGATACPSVGRTHTGAVPAWGHCSSCTRFSKWYLHWKMFTLCVFLLRDNTDVGSGFLRDTWISANTSLL